MNVKDINHFYQLSVKIFITQDIKRNSYHLSFEINTIFSERKDRFHK